MLVQCLSTRNSNELSTGKSIGISGGQSSGWSLDKRPEKFVVTSTTINCNLNFRSLVRPDKVRDCKDLHGGRVDKFDTVVNLFDKGDSIFRSLCDEASLQRVDIVRIRAEHNDTQV